MPYPPVYIDSFRKGLITQGRSALVSPITYASLTAVKRLDAFIGGSNIEISNNFTLIRRPGYPNFCSSTFGVSEWPLNFYTLRKLDGTIKPLVDTQQKVYSFTPSTLTAILTKGTTAQTQFETVGNTLFLCNGTDVKKWDGTTLSNWGIVASSTQIGITPIAGSLTVLRGYQYVYTFRNSSTGTESSASPVSASTNATTSKNFTLSAAGSTDPQVDKVRIYRTLDGGFSFFFVTEIANATTWTFTDSNPDINLNEQIQAPINGQNNPPPATITNCCFYGDRMWVSSGNKLYFGIGGDSLVGVPEESFPPGNAMTMPGNITALWPTNQGLLVFCSDSITVIRGGTQTLTYFPKIWLPDTGILSQNCLASDGETIYLYTTNRQLVTIGASSDDIGFAVQDILQGTFNPATVYMTAHRQGTDSGLFMSDGSANVMYYSLRNQAWSTMATVVGGVGAIGSIETTTATYTLCAGRPTGSGTILGRNLSSFVDGTNSTYTCSVTIGSITLVQPATPLYPLNRIWLDRMPVGSDAVVSILMNDIGSSAFSTIPNPSPGPPELNAPGLLGTGIITKYWDVALLAKPRMARHIQIKIAFPAEAFQNEVLTLTIQPDAS